MKKLILAVAVSTLAVSSVSQAWIIKGQRTTPQPVQSYVTVEDCSESLYINLSTFSSSTDRACSYGRTDLAFQQCTINLANVVGHENVEVAGHACASTRNVEEARCAADLFFKGGTYIVNPAMAADGMRICALPERNQIKNCIIEKYQYRRMSAADAAKVCIEQFDPVAKARKEAELRRIEEERRRQAEARAEEMRRQEEQRRMNEQRRQEEMRRQEEQRRSDEKRRQDDLRRQQEEQRRKQEDARRVEEEKKKQDSKPQAPKAPPKTEAPSAPSNSEDGVIFDLPNFE